MLSRLPLLAGLAFTAVGCAAPALEMRSLELDRRARANPLAAQNELADHKVAVEGVVEETTLLTQSTPVATMSSWGPVGSARVGWEMQAIPVVRLAPGSVLCYFAPELLAEAAALQVGQTARLECVVNSFRVEPGAVLSILTGCQTKK